jgi:hypothetical protein
MRFWVIMMLLPTAAGAQRLLNPARVPARMLDFDRQPGERPLRCDTRPLRPALDFGFRFQAGYVVRVPMNQYLGKGHLWGIVMRITPEGGEPVYLGSRLRLPEVPPTHAQMQISGGYLLGVGRYRVAWKLYDETGRVCHKEWKIDARPGFGDRKVRMALAPGSVSPLYRRTPAAAQPNPDDAPPLRLTILVHAAPGSRRRTRFSGRDTLMLIGTLSSLLGRLPTRSVRLVVFNLDQQKVLYRQNDFTPGRLGEVEQAIGTLQLGTVDYHVLQNRGGQVALLSDLVNREFAAGEPPDVVLFLGPMGSLGERFPAQLVPKPPANGPRFVYLQYRPPFLRMQATLPDLIHSMVSKLRGKVVVMSSPGDFERGIEQIERAAK